MVIARALYGLKSSGASLRAMFAERLSEINFVPTQAGPYVYRQKAQKANGEDYYKLLLVYADDGLTCSHAPQSIMDNLAMSYDLKEGSVREPRIYLGEEIKKYQVISGKEHYSMSSKKYMKNSVKKVEQLLLEEGRTLRDTRTSGKQPLPSKYQPELEQSYELSTDMISRYLQLIGILRWALEIGRIDIFAEVAIML